METLLYALGFLLFVVAAAFFSSLYSIMGIRLKKGTCELANREEIPPWLNTAFLFYEEKLTGLGFEYSHCHVVDAPFVNDYSRKWGLVYFHSTDRSYASLLPADLPEPGNVCDVEFISFLPDGRRLTTINGLSHKILGEIPGTVLSDPYAATLEAQWEYHRKALGESASAGTPVTKLPEDYAQS